MRQGELVKGIRQAVGKSAGGPPAKPRSPFIGIPKRSAVPKNIARCYHALARDRFSGIAGGPKTRRIRFREKRLNSTNKRPNRGKTTLEKREKPEKQDKNVCDVKENILQQDKVCLPLFFILYPTSNYNASNILFCR